MPQNVPIIVDGDQDGARTSSVTKESTVVISHTGGSGGDPALEGRCRVAIVGFAPSSCLLAPFGDTTWVPQNPQRPSFIWGLNELYKVAGVTRADLWFDIHDRRDGDISHRDTGNIEWLRKAPIPVYMQEHYDDIPSSIRYPREDVVRHFRTAYFTNTISYEIALAIMVGRDERGFIVDANRAVGELHIYGVDMAQDAEAYSEYRDQRPSVEYFCGWARAIGIKVYIPPESDLLKSAVGMYGYENISKPLHAKMQARRKELGDRMSNLRNQATAMIQQAQQLQFQAAGIEGALDDTNYWDRCWTMVGHETYSPEDLKALKSPNKDEVLDKIPETKAT